MHMQTTLAPPSGGGAPPRPPIRTVEDEFIWLMEIRTRAAEVQAEAERRLTAIVERFDAADVDPDLEPSLGSTELQNWRLAGATDDREDDADQEDAADADFEPSLGAPERHPSLPFWWECEGGYPSDGRQTRWGQGRDAELVDEDGGDINDAPHDEETDADTGDCEPWLGSLGDVDQGRWSNGDTDDREHDAGDAPEADGGHTEVVAILLAADGAETILRHVGDPLTALAVLEAAAGGDAARVKGVLLKTIRH